MPFGYAMAHPETGAADEPPKAQAIPMERRRLRSAQRLTTKSLELSVAAPQVIAHRVGRMLAAGSRPSRADRSEFVRMGNEKVVAFWQSWASMWTQAGAAQLQAMQSLWRFPPLSRRSAAAAAARAVSGQAAAVTKILHAGLAPVHSKAVGNAKRLTRRRRK